MSKHTKKTWIVENTWICSSCDRKNKGRRMECLGCGSPKEKHEKYDTSENLTASAVTDSKMLRQAQAGENWGCEYCGGSVRNYFRECAFCGGPKTDEAREKTEDGVLCSVCCNASCNGVCEGDFHACKYCGKDSTICWGETCRDECAECGGDITLCRPECTNPFVRPGVRLDDTMPGLRHSRAKSKFETHSGGYRVAPKRLEAQPPLKKSNSGSASDGGDDDFGDWWRKHNWNPIFAGLAIFPWILSVVCLVVWIFVPRTEHVTVKSTTWTYLTYLQQRETRQGSGWDETVPSGAFNESCHTKQRGTRSCNEHQCNAHQESYSCNPYSCNCQTVCSDNGNGYSTCSEVCSTCTDTCYKTVYNTCYDQCPVSDEWCSYSFYVWSTIHTEKLSGHDHEMEEPVLNVQTNSPGPQRVVRERRFSVSFANENDTWTYNPDSVREYNRFTVGTPWVIEVNRVGGIHPQNPKINESIN